VTPSARSHQRRPHLLMVLCLLLLLLSAPLSLFHPSEPLYAQSDPSQETNTPSPTEPDPTASPTTLETATTTHTATATRTVSPSLTASPSATASPASSPSATLAASRTTTPSASQVSASPTANATSGPQIEQAATETATIVPTMPLGSISLEIEKLLQGSDEVQVGQYLTFTIRIENTGSITVTELPVIDEYEPSILEPQLGRISPAPDSHTTGVIRWNDLTDSLGDMGPGQVFEIEAVFRALRIDDEVINQARVEAAVGQNGEGGGDSQDDAKGKVKGGNVIVLKELKEDFIRLDQPIISFTLTLRNDGYTDIVTLPFEDKYLPNVIQFIGSSIAPDEHLPEIGKLRWNNLLASFGISRLAPQQEISIDTSYLVIGDIEDAVVNSADAVDVADEFGNRVESPRRAEVRIRIRGGTVSTPTVTSTPEATATATVAATKQPSGNQSGGNNDDRKATVTAEATATPEQTEQQSEATAALEATQEAETTAEAGADDSQSATPTPQSAIPSSLPQTAEPSTLPIWPLLVAGIAIGLAGLSLRMRRKRGAA
jgi:hypothetical protein